MPAALLLAVLLASPAPAAEPPFQSLARDLVGPDQGVYAVAEDGTVLAAVEAERAVHPASVTKVATTLALLRQLGPGHRFATRVLAAGPVEAGKLRADSGHKGPFSEGGPKWPYRTFEPTAVAPDAGKAPLEHPTPEEATELTLDEAWHAGTVRGGRRRGEEADTTLRRLVRPRIARSA